MVLPPLAIVAFFKPFAALLSVARQLDRNHARAPSHRKAQRAQWRRGVNLHDRPSRKHRPPRHYLVSGHLDFWYARHWRHHYKPQPFALPPPAPNISSSRPFGWAHCIVQWAMRFGTAFYSKVPSASAVTSFFAPSIDYTWYLIGIGTRANFLHGIYSLWDAKVNAFEKASSFFSFASWIFLITDRLSCLHHFVSSTTSLWPFIYLTLYISIPRLYVSAFEDVEDPSFVSAMMVVSSEALRPWPTSHLSRFDSDSFPVGIDNQTSRCISYNKDHFEDLELIDIGECTGFDGSSTPIRGKGTLVFHLQDDWGQWHIIRVPNSLYIPGAQRVLICPQHWAQEAADGGTYEITSSNATILVWDRSRLRRTIPLHPSTNTPVFYSRAGNRIIEAFTAEYLSMDAAAHQPREQSILLPPGSLLSSDSAQGNAWDGEELISTTPLNSDDHPGSQHKRGESTSYTTVSSSHDGPAESPIEADFESIDVPSTLESTDRSAELMRYHYRLGHMPFSKLQLLARLGEIPRALADVTPPRCAGCLFGAMTRKPWRTKPRRGEQASRIFPATRPGQTVSVDQMQSSSIGFIAQLKGKLTNTRYTCATVFVDHFSRYRYVHLQSSLSSADTLAAKRAFELHARSMGVEILHYQADNGRFQDNAFRNSCTASGQRLTFCSVNALNQNGISERAIRDLTDQARKMLLFALSRWPQAIDLSLWPYAFRTAAFIHNHTPQQIGIEHTLRVYLQIACNSIKCYITQGLLTFKLSKIRIMVTSSILEMWFVIRLVLIS